jgi:hypothetical protein
MIGQIPNFLTPAYVPACALLAAGSPTTPAYVVTSAGRSVSQRVNENLRIPTAFGRDLKTRRYQ